MYAEKERWVLYKYNHMSKILFNSFITERNCKKLWLVQKAFEKKYTYKIKKEMLDKDFWIKYKII